MISGFAFNGAISTFRNDGVRDIWAEHFAVSRNHKSKILGCGAIFCPLSGILREKGDGL